MLVHIWISQSCALRSIHAASTTRVQSRETLATLSQISSTTQRNRSYHPTHLHHSSHPCAQQCTLQPKYFIFSGSKMSRAKPVRSSDQIRSDPALQPCLALSCLVLPTVLNLTPPANAFQLDRGRFEKLVHPSVCGLFGASDDVGDGQNSERARERETGWGLWRG
ncbi:hypothetical protein BDV95DRAFT_143035 [Massariosphaeria phaeospora]|uniref:Uncharacterized protein n=1 Tax=Massariosphaeria phaeospora TaxID=100035 RepID=A0A7C8MJT1_9PLEO|nr:hypothetical protein BDV95DRAFT_143035 [Massariosphaeria phaeospora]